MILNITEDRYKMTLEYFVMSESKEELKSKEKRTMEIFHKDTGASLMWFY